MDPNPRNTNHQDFYNQKSAEDKIKFLLRYAVLAPSTHNTQPWLFKIDRSICRVYFDPRYILKEADPTLRNLYISLGCAIENFALAAAYFGVLNKVEYILKDNHVADIYINEDTKDTQSKLLPLMDTMLTRANTRGFFSKKVIDPTYLGSLRAIEQTGHYKDSQLTHHTVTDNSSIEKIARLTKEGLKSAYKRDIFREEMSEWVHNNLTKKKDGMPGYSLKMPFLISFIFSFMVKHFNIGEKLGTLNYLSLRTAPLVNVITAKENSPTVWLNTGRLAERLMLEFNSVGIRTSIFVASIEMGEFYKEVQGILGTDETPQFLFIAGYTNNVQKLTPRHNVESKLL